MDANNKDNSVDLQAEIDRVKREQVALQQEFNVAAIEDDPNTGAAAVRKALISAAPQAIKEIISLAGSAEADGVRLSASKYIVDVALGKVQIGDPTTDNLNKLLEAIKKKPSAASAPKKKTL